MSKISGIHDGFFFIDGSAVDAKDVEAAVKVDPSDNVKIYKIKMVLHSITFEVAYDNRNDRDDDIKTLYKLMKGD